MTHTDKMVAMGYVLCGAALMCIHCPDTHTDKMVGMGYARQDIEDSIAMNKYDHIHATYLLLGRSSPTEVTPPPPPPILCIRNSFRKIDVKYVHFRQ